MLLKISIIFTILFSLCQSKILKLTDDNFIQKIVDYEWILIMFDAPWCQSCKKFKIIFGKSEATLAAHDPSISLGIVDCSDNGKETCEQFKITSYPVVKLFNDGKLYNHYTGPKELKGLIKYVKAQVGPSVQLLSSSEELEEFLNDNHVSVVGFVNQNSHLKDILYTTGDSLKEHFFFGLVTANLTNQLCHCLNCSDSLVLFRPEYLHNNFEEKHLQFRSGNQQAFSNWLLLNKHGLVGHRTRQNQNDYLLPLVIAYFKIDYDKNPKGTNYWRNRILKVAANYSNDFNFAMSLKDDFQTELLDFGYGYVRSETPIIVARTQDHSKYKMTQDFTIDNFIDFLEGIKNRTLESYIKSEPISEKNDKRVKKAVAKNFKSIVMENENDVLLKLYASWCIDCRKAAPIFEEVANQLKNEKVDLVKMNARKNDVLPPFAVQTFPTIFFIPKNKKENIIRFTDDINSKNLIKFIATHATEELRGYDREGISKSKYEL